MKFTEIDKNNIKVMRDLIQSKLDELRDECGINIKMGTIRFNDFSFHAKIEAELLTKTEQKNQMTPKEIWDGKCVMVGLIGKDFKENFLLNGKQMNFVKFDFAKRKYPIIVTDGIKQYKISVEQYKRGVEL